MLRSTKRVIRLRKEFLAGQPHDYPARDDQSYFHWFDVDGAAHVHGTVARSPATAWFSCCSGSDDGHVAGLMVVNGGPEDVKVTLAAGSPTRTAPAPALRPARSPRPSSTTGARAPALPPVSLTSSRPTPSISTARKLRGNRHAQALDCRNAAAGACRGGPCGLQPFHLTGRHAVPCGPAECGTAGNDNVGTHFRDVGTDREADVGTRRSAVVVRRQVHGRAELIRPPRHPGIPAAGRRPAVLALIRQGGPYRYTRDGATFGNFERILPRKASGYYKEYTVPTPGESDRGARRIVAGQAGEKYYSPDHYGSFKLITEGK